MRKSSTISSFSVAFMLESLNFWKDVGDRWPTAEVLDAKPVERVTVSKLKSPTVSPETQDFLI